MGAKRLQSQLVIELVLVDDWERAVKSAKIDFAEGVNGSPIHGHNI
jgi:hypothetical protein